MYNYIFQVSTEPFTADRQAAPADVMTFADIPTFTA